MPECPACNSQLRVEAGGRRLEVVTIAKPRVPWKPTAKVREERPRAPRASRSIRALTGEPGVRESRKLCKEDRHVPMEAVLAVAAVLDEKGVSWNQVRGPGQERDLMETRHEAAAAAFRAGAGWVEVGELLNRHRATVQRGVERNGGVNGPDRRT